MIYEFETDPTVKAQENEKIFLFELEKTGSGQIFLKVNGNHVLAFQPRQPVKRFKIKDDVGISLYENRVEFDWRRQKK